MTEIAATAIPLLCGGPKARPEIESIYQMIESELKTETGWSPAIDIWRDGTAQARSDMLADLLYRRPTIAATLVETLLAGRYPHLLKQLAQRIQDSGPSAALDPYRHLPEADLLQALLLSPERVLTFADVLCVPVPLSTAERVLWAAAQRANASDATKLQYLVSRLTRLREQLELVGQTLDRSPDAAARRGSATYRKAVDREIERTEASMRRLEQLLAGLRTSTMKPGRRAPQRGFRVSCRRRELV